MKFFYYAKGLNGVCEGSCKIRYFSCSEAIERAGMMDIHDWDKEHGNARLSKGISREISGGGDLYVETIVVVLVRFRLKRVHVVSYCLELWLSFPY
jgi:hypothetical protein